RRGIHRGAVRDEDLFGERLPRQRFEAGAQALGRFVRCDDDGEPHQPERNRKTVRTGFEVTTSRPIDAPTAAFTPRTIGALDGKSFATSPSTDIAASVSTGSQPAATGIAIPCVFQILQDVRAKARSPFPRNASATPWRPIRGTSARDASAMKASPIIEMTTWVPIWSRPISSAWLTPARSWTVSAITKRYATAAASKNFEE